MNALETARTKWCNRCAEFKDIDEFYRDPTKSSGRSSFCKQCKTSNQQLSRLLKKEDTVNQQKFEQAYRGLSSQAKKVYDAVPIVESWSPTQLIAELRRRNSSMSEVRVVMGCLNTLKEGGLVIEPVKGYFKREAIRPKSEIIEQETFITETPKDIEMKANIETSVKLAPTPQISPIDRLSGLASRLRDLATDMDNAALELADQAEKNEQKTAKLDQLQALLKSLG